jgi:hypothetical protein
MFRCEECYDEQGKQNCIVESWHLVHKWNNNNNDIILLPLVIIAYNY